MTIVSKSCLGSSLLTNDIDTLLNTNISVSSLNISSDTCYNKVYFSGITTFDIPIDFVNYKASDIILNYYFTGSGSNATLIYIAYNGATIQNYSSIAQVFNRGSNEIPIYENGSNILCSNMQTGISTGSLINIKLNNITNSTAIDIRGSYYWPAYGNTRLDGSGVLNGTGGVLTITAGVGSTFMNGFYQIKNDIN